jgi:hypothetical protein
MHYGCLERTGIKFMTILGQGPVHRPGLMLRNFSINYVRREKWRVRKLLNSSRITKRGGGRSLTLR